MRSADCSAVTPDSPISASNVMLVDPESNLPTRVGIRRDEDGKRIRLQDLPNLTQNKGAGAGFGAWPAYRVSNGQLWGMQRRINDCFRQQRMPYPEFASDVTVALSVYMGVTGKGVESKAPALKR